MIENRVRLEREILRGRRAVRKSMQARERMQHPHDLSAFDTGNVADMSIGSPQSPDRADDGLEDVPWASDTDTDASGEIQQRRNSLRIRLGLAEASGNTTPLEMKYSKDPLRSQSRRQLWASQMLDVDRADEAGPSKARMSYNRFGTPDPPPENKPAPVPTLNTSTSSGFLARLRTRSFPSFPTRFTSPFSPRSSGTHRPPNKDVVGHTWSSDSSELEDELHLNDGGLSDPSYELDGNGVAEQPELLPGDIYKS